jgi:hypothetical protein
LQEATIPIETRAKANTKGERRRKVREREREERGNRCAIPTKAKNTRVDRIHNIGKQR